MSRKKPKLSLQEQEDAVIAKYMTNQPMTLEEVSVAIWMIEGRKTKKPFSKMYMCKIEQAALKKIREKVETLGIKCVDDVFDVARGRHAVGFRRMANDVDG